MAAPAMVVEGLTIVTTVKSLISRLAIRANDASTREIQDCL